MSTSIPKSYKAVTIQGEKAGLTEVSLPKYESDSLVVKVMSAAANPTDWKHIDFKFGPQGSIVGCDLAGQVVAMGEEAEKSGKFQIGDAVCAVVHGCSVLHPENGAFAEYAVTDYKLTLNFKKLSLEGKDVPFGPVKSYEGAASLPVSLYTAGLVFYDIFKVKLPSKGDSLKPQFDSPLLIWGGATAVGQHLVQLAKITGAFESVIVVASKKHESFLKSLGADYVVDYHDEDVIGQIKEISDDRITHAVDGVSSQETIKQTEHAVSEFRKATVIELMGYSQGYKKEDIKKNVSYGFTLLYFVTGWKVPFGPNTFPPQPEVRNSMIKFLEWVAPPLLEEGTIKHIPISYYSGGLEAVPQLLSDIKTGKNSGVKLVVDV